MAYLDGFVLAVPTAHRAAYLDLARTAAAVFRRHGALQVVEAWGDDVPAGVKTSFPLAVQAGPDESIVFSWVVWADRASRDAGMAAVFADPEMKMPDPPIFDGSRMIVGGFEVILDA